MKNIVLIVVFMITFNMMIGLGIAMLTNQDMQSQHANAELYVQNQVLESYDIAENQVITGSQSEYSTDLMPPVDTNPAAVSVLTHLKNGITLEIPQSMVNSEFEQNLYFWIYWVIQVIRLVCVAWVFIVVWAKVVHP